MHTQSQILGLTAAFILFFALAGCEQGDNHGHSHDHGHSHAPASTEQVMNSSSVEKTTNEVATETDKTSHKSIF